MLDLHRSFILVFQHGRKSAKKGWLYGQALIIVFFMKWFNMMRKFLTFCIKNKNSYVRDIKSCN